MLTLKLSHVHWQGAPYRWSYEWNDTSISGPACWVDESVEEIQQATGAAFMSDRLYLPYQGGERDEKYAGIYVLVHSDLPDTPAIWFLSGTEVNQLAADFAIASVAFHGELSENIETWIGGVRQVTALAEINPNQVRHVSDDKRFAHLDLETWTWLGSDKKTIRKVILVSLDNGDTRAMLVERAWLLGPNGDTIQKICP